MKPALVPTCSTTVLQGDASDQHSHQDLDIAKTFETCCQGISARHASRSRQASECELNNVESHLSESALPDGAAQPNCM